MYDADRTCLYGGIYAYYTHHRRRRPRSRPRARRIRAKNHRRSHLIARSQGPHPRGIGSDLLQWNSTAADSTWRRNLNRRDDQGIDGRDAMTWLLDVNVLIALIDPRNVHHQTAHTWFARVGQSSWASCPLTENGVIRVVGN